MNGYPDGIHWTLRSEPVVVDHKKHYGAFNTAFHDDTLGKYVAYMEVQQSFQDVVGCTASKIVADHAEYPRLLANTTIGTIHLGDVRDDRFVMPGRQSPMLVSNRVLLGNASRDQSLTVICRDGLGTAAYNVLYGYDDGQQRSTEMLLYGVGARSGNRQTWGRWQEQLDQFAKPHYLRAQMDFDFKKRYEDKQGMLQHTF